MTVLAEVWSLLDKEFCMPAAVGRMADSTIFFDRGMFINKRSSFFLMALIAELIDIFCVDHAMR